MSANCWEAIENAVRGHPRCRYLEWGSGNSTLALLRLALESPGMQGLELRSIENDPAFAAAMLDAVAGVFRRASVDGVVRVERLRFSKSSFLKALASDPGMARYEARFLELLWDSRNDGFWISSAQASGSLGLRRSLLWRHLVRLRCGAAFRWQRLRRALEKSEGADVVIASGSAQSPTIPSSRVPSRVTFDTERVRLEFLVIPQLRNWLWRRGPILDGLYQEFADYVSVPLEGRFDVILVDGRARTSCLKRVHHDRLLAPGGMLFLHDAHRPSHHEALQHFGSWSYISGSNVRLDGTAVTPGRRAGQPPLVRSGPSMQQLKAVFDRELYFYEEPLRLEGSSAGATGDSTGGTAMPGT